MSQSSGTNTSKWNTPLEGKMEAAKHKGGRLVKSDTKYWLSMLVPMTLLEALGYLIEQGKLASCS